MRNDVKITVIVVGGLCELVFAPGYSTGPDDDTNPGIGFDGFASFVTGPGTSLSGEFHFGHGVIGREDAAKLRDMLEIFLKNHAAGVSA